MTEGNPLFSVRFDQILVNFQRSKHDDHDDDQIDLIVNVGLDTKPAAHLQGFTTGVTTGQTIDLSTVTAFMEDPNNPGTFIPSPTKWEVPFSAFELPPSTEIYIQYAVTNLRQSHADSLQLVTKVFFAIEETVVGVTAIGLGQEAAAIVVNGVLQAIDGGVEAAVGSGNADCAGPVLVDALPTNTTNLENDLAPLAPHPSPRVGSTFRREKQTRRQGLQLDAPSACGPPETRPQATAFISLIRDTIPAFDTTPRTDKFLLRPVAGQAVNAWQGLWGDQAQQKDCRVFCDIVAHSQAIVLGGHNVDVAATEFFGQPPGSPTQVHQVTGRFPGRGAATNSFENLIPDPIGSINYPVPFARPDPHGNAVTGGPAADTVAVDATVSLQLYGQFATATDDSLAKFAVRYIRRDEQGNVLTDVMLEPTSKALT
jgi:hypothetical protein